MDERSLAPDNSDMDDTGTDGDASSSVADDGADDREDGAGHESGDADAGAGAHPVAEEALLRTASKSPPWT